MRRRPDRVGAAGRRAPGDVADPTGGLADVVGRRLVLVAFGVLHLLSRLAPGPLALGLPRDLPGSPERRAPQPVANVDLP